MADESQGWYWGFLTDLAIINPARSEAESLPATFHYVDLSSLSTGGIANIAELAIFAKNDAPSRAQRQLREGDSLVATVRPERGARGLVGAELDNQVGSTGLCVLRPIKKADARFLYSIIRQDEFTEWCVANSTGTSYPAVSQQAIGGFPLFLPPTRERALIGDVLGALDDKIKSNYRLSSIAINLYRTELRKMLLQFSVSGVGGLLELSSVLSRYSVRIGDVEAPEFSATVTGLEPRDNRFKKELSAGRQKNKKIRLGDLVFGFSRKTLSFGIMKDQVGSVSPVYEVFGVRGGLEVAELVEMQIRDQMDDFMDILKPGAREGQPIEAEYLLKKKLILPHDPGSFLIPEQVTNLAQIAEISNSENRKLELLRNTLLPELLSGRLRVKDADTMMENV